MALFHRLLFILIACLAVGLTLAFAPARAAQFYTEDLRIPMAEAGPQGLEAFLVRPAGSKRYPLALLSHGTPRSFADRATMNAHEYYGIALEYARRGFAALIVMRRGYGTSPGGRVDSVGGCANAAYLPAAAIAVTDLRAAIDAMARRADVTTTGMIAAGHSAGGLATVALTAQPPPGLVAAISFAGGRGSRDDDGDVCNEDGLVQAFASFGKTSRVPMLWVYATNDLYLALIWRAASMQVFAPAAATRNSSPLRLTATTVTISIPWRAARNGRLMSTPFCASAGSLTTC